MFDQQKTLNTPLESNFTCTVKPQNLELSGAEKKNFQYIWGLEILRLKYSWTLGSQIPWICKSDSEVPSTYSPSISPSIWRKFFLSSIEFEMRFDCKERKCSWNFQLPSTYPWYLRYKYSWYWSSTVHGNKFVKWTE